VKKRWVTEAISVIAAVVARAVIIAVTKRVAAVSAAVRLLAVAVVLAVGPMASWRCRCQPRRSRRVATASVAPIDGPRWVVRLVARARRSGQAWVHRARVWVDPALRRAAPR
jgi:hypothetical protein